MIRRTLKGANIKKDKKIKRSIPMGWQPLKKLNIVAMLLLIVYKSFYKQKHGSSNGRVGGCRS